MKTTFLVLGRPRSRTAWVANLLTVPPTSFCFHEGLADSASDYDRLKSRMDELTSNAVGSADTGFIHDLDRVIETFPAARLVLMVNGDVSWKRWSAGRIPDWFRDLIDGHYTRAQKLLYGRALFVDCMAVTRSVDAARALWEHCIPDQEFDLARWTLLKDLNVQVDLDSLPRRFEASGGVIH